MKRHSRIALVSLAGVGVLFVFLFRRVLDSADISPIVRVSTPPSIPVETDDTLDRPERTSIATEDVLVRTERSPVDAEPVTKRSNQTVAFRPKFRVKGPPAGVKTANIIDAPVEPAVLDGFVKTYHENGRVESEGPYLDGERDGYWVYYSEHGAKELCGTYRYGKAEGAWTAWHKNGRVRSEGQCRNGKFDGLCSFWNEDGVLDAERSGHYQRGVLLAPR